MPKSLSKAKKRPKAGSLAYFLTALMMIPTNIGKTMLYNDNASIMMT
jgi:hypothetical protein